jgi:hypothetical protein
MLTNELLNTEVLSRELLNAKVLSRELLCLTSGKRWLLSTELLLGLSTQRVEGWGLQFSLLCSLEISLSLLRYRLDG